MKVVGSSEDARLVESTSAAVELCYSARSAQAGRQLAPRDELKACASDSRARLYGRVQVFKVARCRYKTHFDKEVGRVPAGDRLPLPLPKPSCEEGRLSQALTVGWTRADLKQSS